MENKKFKKVTAILATAALMVTMGVTAAFANDVNVGKAREDKVVREALTEEQKAQMMETMKEKLAEELADGRITQERYDQMLAGIENGKMQKFDGKRPMNDEGRAEMADLKAQWDALSDSQKQELYDLYDEKLSIESKIVDKYLELGLFEAEAAEKMKENFSQQRDNMMKNGNVPLFGHGFKIAPASNIEQ